MKRKASIVISLLLLLTLSAGSFLYYTYLDCSQATLKFEAHESIAQKGNAALDVIKVAAKSFNKHDDEIWYGGHLYDIGAYSIVHDTVVISVLHDEKEEALVNIINEYFASSNDVWSSYTGHRISAKHIYNPNDVKCLTEGITIVHACSMEKPFFATSAASYAICRSKAVDAPPPRA